MRVSPRVLSALSAVALWLTVIGCNTAPSTPAPAGGGDASGPVQPKVNRVVMAVDPVGTETNELRKLSSPDVWIFRSVYEYPLAIDIVTEKLVPGLATEWAIEDGGATYRLKVRKGVPFHEGFGELTAKDFAHQPADIAGPEGVHGQTAYWRRIIKDVQVVNDYEVAYHLTSPDAQFLLALSESQGGGEIRSKAKYDKAGVPANLKTAEAGTGWYQFKDREQGQYLRLERNAQPHWSGTTPDFPEFEFRFVREPSTRLASLLTGEVHLTALPEDLLQQATRSSMKIVKSQIPGLRIMAQFHCCHMLDKRTAAGGWRYPDSPLANQKVRKALNKAVNKDEMNKAFFGGKGFPMYLNSFLPTREGWNPDWERRYRDEYGYDAAAARALLAEAGFGVNNPLKTTVFVTPVPGISAGPDVSEAIATYWRAVGVDVALVTIQGAELSARNRSCLNDNHLWVRGTGSNQWTGSSVYNGANYGTGCSGVEDPDLEAAFLALEKTSDEKQRGELWRKAGDTLFDKHMTLSLFWFSAEAAINPTIVADWKFPGSLTGTWTHVHNIKAAR